MYERHGMKHYHATELVVREDIMAKTKELADLLNTSEEVRMYKEAEQKIQNNERVQQMISTIKKKQKEIVGFEYFQNGDMVRKIEGEIQALQDELDQIPVVQQFQQTQADINYLLQLVIRIIKDSLSEHLDIDKSEPEAHTGHCGD